MDRLRLNGPLVVRGLSIWNGSCELTIEPLADDTDDRWILRFNGEDVPITADLMYPVQGRTVGLYLGRTLALCEFEHIGFLHALGVRGVRMYLSDLDNPANPSPWPPYLCSSELLRQLIQVGTTVCGALEPYALPNQEQRGGSGANRQRPPGFVACSSWGARGGTHFRVRIEYGAGRVHERTLTLPKDIRDKELADIASARTLGKPKGLRWLCILLTYLPLWPWHHPRRWPHRGKVQWEKGCPEEARHSLLDKLWVSILAPSGYYLQGGFYFDCSGHKQDIGFAAAVLLKIRSGLHP